MRDRNACLLWSAMCSPGTIFEALTPSEECSNSPGQYIALSAASLQPSSYVDGSCLRIGLGGRRMDCDQVFRTLLQDSDAAQALRNELRTLRRLSRGINTLSMCQCVNVPVLGELRSTCTHNRLTKPFELDYVWCHHSLLIVLDYAEVFPN